MVNGSVFMVRIVVWRNWASLYGFKGSCAGSRCRRGFALGGDHWYSIRKMHEEGAAFMVQKYIT